MASTKSIALFRRMLQRSLLLNVNENKAFERIPDDIFEGIFRHNFNGNLKLAERVLFNRYSGMEHVDRGRLENEKLNIRNRVKATQVLVDTLVKGENVLFVTDNDNDGSLAQAVLIEFLKYLPLAVRQQIHVEYAQPIGHARGLTVEVVEKAVVARGWEPSSVFTIVTADNGINNRAEQEKIAQQYPNARLIVTDHHLPDPDKVILENKNTLIFNPKNVPTDYFKKKNISGANTLGVLLTSVAHAYQETSLPGVDVTQEQKQALANMDEIGLWANLLDYANSDIADMPNRPYTIEKALSLRPLMNVSTSMSNLVTGAFDEDAVSDIAKASNGLSALWILERLDDVKTLNALSQSLLGLYHLAQKNDETGVEPLSEKSETDFYEALAKEISRDEASYVSINPNYIEQLRPIIFNLSAIDNKPIFMALLSDTMASVFEELRAQERAILEQLRTVGLLRQDRRPSSTILYPIHPSVTKVFNRRLLGKAYNQDNNGFLLILSSVEGDKAAGSMRSLYNISDILEGREAIEKELGITIDVQGHEQAAGFSVQSVDGSPISEERLSRLNNWIDNRLTTIKAADRINQMSNVEIDFASVGLVTKINAAVKANLAGMWGLPAILTLSPDADDEVWVTDNATTRQVSVSEIVATRRYGYQAIRTSFHGDAIIVPVELLRAVVESGYKKSLRLSYMDEGVFMAHQVVDTQAMPNKISLNLGRSDQDDLAKYYEEHHKETPFITLSREDFKNSPYFRYNRYGDQEFEHWENTIITLLDKTGQDVMAVVDTEGTGLGKAPKCFNIGGTNVKIAQGSGVRLDRDAFESGYFRNEKGEEFLLTPEQVSSLTPLEGDFSTEERSLVLHRTSLRDGVHYDERYVFSGSFEDLERVFNVKLLSEYVDNYLASPAANSLTEDEKTKLLEDREKVIYNRQIDGFAFAFLISDVDFAITKEFEDLTGISTAMIRRLGVPAAQADAAIVEYYRNLKGPSGEPAKIIFQAHNMPYDRGVATANLQGLVDLMNENVTSDTAKIARMKKLAYDDTPVSYFPDIEGIPPKVYFYDSPFSDYSLSIFLQRAREGKGGVFPDTRAQMLLRYRPETEQFSIIDRTANREVMLAASMSDIESGKVFSDLPNNAVKYSVERLSSRAMIRNILLLDKPLPIKVSLLPLEQNHRAALELFQEKYHFDQTAVSNVENFLTSLAKNENAGQFQVDVGRDGLLALADRFLDANRSLQARFHDGWIYEKVLGVFEPDAQTFRIPEGDIEQINYLTDLPNAKIREVLDATIRFKRHFKIDHALVHEEHNNIRQRSDDGQGLSDTAYEVVLPQMLTMLKSYNPYYQSVDPAVKCLIDSNIKGSMIQTMVKEKYGSDLAQDSYSMTQMLAFDRSSVTESVQAARDLIAVPGPGEDLKEIKMGLRPAIMPDNAAVYAIPRAYIPLETVRDLSKKLTDVFIVEQTKAAVLSASKMDVNDAERVLNILSAHDDSSISTRNEILGYFKSVSFERRDEMIKKVSSWVSDVFENKSLDLSNRVKVSEEMISLTEDLAADYMDIYDRIHQPVSTEYLENLLGQMRQRLETAIAKEAVRTAKASRASSAPVVESVTANEDSETNHENEVRTDNFFPSLEIARRNPLKFLLNQGGISFLLPFVKKKMLEREMDNYVETYCEASPASSRRKP